MTVKRKLSTNEGIIHTTEADNSRKSCPVLLQIRDPDSILDQPHAREPDVSLSLPKDNTETSDATSPGNNEDNDKALSSMNDLYTTGMQSS